MKNSLKANTVAAPKAAKVTTPTEANILKMAAICLYKARKYREVHPYGEFDNAGRWYPNGDEESDDFTNGIRAPSRAYPFSYMKSARTKRHCVNLITFAPKFLISCAMKTLEFKDFYQPIIDQKAALASKKAELSARSHLAYIKKKENAVDEFVRRVQAA